MAILDYNQPTRKKFGEFTHNIALETQRIQSFQLLKNGEAHATIYAKKGFTQNCDCASSVPFKILTEWVEFLIEEYGLDQSKLPTPSPTK